MEYRTVEITPHVVGIKKEMLDLDSFFEFMHAALPWIAMGLLLAVFLARGTSRKKDKETKEDYGSEGMALGMCFGVAMASALHLDIGLGLTLGMLLGLAVGSGIEKKDDQEKEKKTK